MTALALAKYIVNFALEKNCPISNLQLQKILYFLNGRYYAVKKLFLTEEPFFAYPLGPVNKMVYLIYRGYGASKILDQSDISLDQSIDSQLVRDILDELVCLSARELVDLSHQRGGAWDRTQKANGLYGIISNQLIREEFANG